MRPQVSMLP